jgi:hypothetical protein
MADPEQTAPDASGTRQRWAPSHREKIHRRGGGASTFGPKKLPDAGRSLGRGIKEFKGAITGGSSSEPVADVDQPG